MDNGLYLMGCKYPIMVKGEYLAQFEQEDGHCIDNIQIRLGVWYHYPSLHHYFINNFSEGVESAQPQLSEKDILKVISDIDHDRIPYVESSQPPNETTDLDYVRLAFKHALEWLRIKDGFTREVFLRY